MLAMRRVRWGLAFLLILVGAGACSKAEEKKSESLPAKSASSSAAAALPEDARIAADITPGIKGGKLIMGFPGDPKTLNPILSEDVESTKLSDFLFARLYDFDRVRQEDAPALAKSWEYREATREWVFQLRKGLRWSDGQPLTSGDVLFYCEAMMDPRVPNVYRDGMKTGGKPYLFSAPDPLTFIATIPEVDSFAFQNLIEIRALPRHKYATALAAGTFAETLGNTSKPEEVVTSGAFKVKSIRSGESFVLEANPYYFTFDKNGTRLPYVDEFTLLIVPNYDAMALRFQAGDTDLIEEIQPQNLVVLQDGETKGDYKVYSPGMRLTNVHFWFNQKSGGSYMDDDGKRVGWDPPTPGATPPPEILARSYRPYVDPIKLQWFGNEEFRKACSMAARRDVMIKTILFGQGEALYGPEGSSNKRWNNDDIPKFPYDPAKAAKTLDAINFIDRDGDGIREDPQGHPIRFTLITNKENSVREKVGVLLKEDLRHLGIDVNFQVLDFNDIVTRNSDTYDYEACLLGLESGIPPHPAQASNIYPSSARMHTWNPGQKTPATPWEARIDELYEAMKKTFDYSKQKKLYDEIQSVWAEHQCVIHLFTNQLNVAASNRVGNLKPTVLRPYLTHNIAELYIKPR